MEYESLPANKVSQRHPPAHHTANASSGTHGQTIRLLLQTQFVKSPPNKVNDTKV